MAFLNLSTPRVAASSLAKQKAKRPEQTIFSKYHDKAVKDISKSIEEFKARYGLDGKASKVNIKPKPSKNWKVVPGTEENASSDQTFDLETSNEHIALFWKVGPRFLEIWDEIDGDKDSVKLYIVPARNGLTLLHEMQSAIESLAADSELGKIFHQAAIETSGIRAKGVYDPEQDNYV